MDSSRSPSVTTVRMTSEEMISRSSTWTLACDNALLKRMKDFSDNLVGQAEEITNDVDSLAKDVCVLQSHVHNVTNQFLMLSNTKFVENRVEEFVETLTPQVPSQNTPVKTKAEKEAALIAKMKEAIQIGVAVKADQESNRGAKADGESSFPQLNLPHLIGSSKFFSSRYCGLLDESKLFVHAANDDNININSPSEFSEPKGPDTSSISNDTVTYPNTFPHQPLPSNRELNRPPSTNNLLDDSASSDDLFGYNGTPALSNILVQPEKGIAGSQHVPPVVFASQPKSIVDDLTSALRARAPPPLPVDSEESDDEFKAPLPGQGLPRRFFADVDDEDDDLFGANSSFSSRPNEHVDDDSFFDKVPQSSGHSNIFRHNIPPTPILFQTTPPTPAKSSSAQSPAAKVNRALFQERPPWKDDDNDVLIPVPTTLGEESTNAKADQPFKKADVAPVIHDELINEPKRKAKLPYGAVSMFGGLPPPVIPTSKSVPPKCHTAESKIYSEESVSVVEKQQSIVDPGATLVKPSSVISNNGSTGGSPANVNKHQVDDAVSVSSATSRETGTGSFRSGSQASLNDIMEDTFTKYPKKTTGVNSIFEDDSEDDLFFAKKTFTSTHKPIPSTLFGEKSNPTSQSINTNRSAPSSNTVRGPKTRLKSPKLKEKSIFADSDSDDGLFSSASSTTSKNKSLRSSLFQDSVKPTDDDDLFVHPTKTGEPAVNATHSIVGASKLDPDHDSVPPLPKQEPEIKMPTGAVSMFGDRPPSIFSTSAPRNYQFEPAIPPGSQVSARKAPKSVHRNSGDVIAIVSEQVDPVLVNISEKPKASNTLNIKLPPGAVSMFGGLPPPIIPAQKVTTHQDHETASLSLSGPMSSSGGGEVLGSDKEEVTIPVTSLEKPKIKLPSGAVSILSDLPPPIILTQKLTIHQDHIPRSPPDIDQEEPELLSQSTGAKNQDTVPVTSSETPKIRLPVVAVSMVGGLLPPVPVIPSAKTVTHHQREPRSSPPVLYDNSASSSEDEAFPTPSASVCNRGSINASQDFGTKVEDERSSCTRTSTTVDSNTSSNSNVPHQRATSSATNSKANDLAAGSRGKVGTKSIFEEDSDEDIFASKKPVTITKLFEDESFPTASISTQAKPRSTVDPPAAAKRPTEPPKKEIKSIFVDSDSDGELFSSSKFTRAKKDVPVVKIPVKLTDKAGDIFARHSPSNEVSMTKDAMFKPMFEDSNPGKVAVITQLRNREFVDDVSPVFSAEKPKLPFGAVSMFGGHPPPVFPVKRSVPDLESSEESSDDIGFGLEDSTELDSPALATYLNASHTAASSSETLTTTCNSETVSNLLPSLAKNRPRIAQPRRLPSRKHRPLESTTNSATESTPNETPDAVPFDPLSDNPPNGEADPFPHSSKEE